MEDNQFRLTGNLLTIKGKVRRVVSVSLQFLFGIVPVHNSNVKWSGSVVFGLGIFILEVLKTYIFYR